MMKNAVLIMDDKIHIRRRRFLNIWKRVEIPPTFVFVGKVAEVIPVVIGRLFRLKGTDCIILPIAVKITTVAPCMTEDTIEDDPHPLFPSRMNEMMKIFIRAEDWIDLMVIARIITMITFRFKNRIEI